MTGRDDVDDIVRTALDVARQHLMRGGPTFGAGLPGSGPLGVPSTMTRPQAVLPGNLEHAYLRHSLRMRAHFAHGGAADAGDAQVEQALRIARDAHGRKGPAVWHPSGRRYDAGDAHMAPSHLQQALALAHRAQSGGPLAGRPHFDDGGDSGGDNGGGYGGGGVGGFGGYSGSGGDNYGGSFGGTSGGGIGGFGGYSSSGNDNYGGTYGGGSSSESGNYGGSIGGGYSSSSSDGGYGIGGFGGAVGSVSSGSPSRSSNDADDGWSNSSSPVGNGMASDTSSLVGRAMSQVSSLSNGSYAGPGAYGGSYGSGPGGYNSDGSYNPGSIGPSGLSTADGIAANASTGQTGALGFGNFGSNSLGSSSGVGGGINSVGFGGMGGLGYGDSNPAASAIGGMGYSDVGNWASPLGNFTTQSAPGNPYGALSFSGLTSPSSPAPSLAETSTPMTDTPANPFGGLSFSAVNQQPLPSSVYASMFGGFNNALTGSPISGDGTQATAGQTSSPLGYGAVSTPTQAGFDNFGLSKNAMTPSLGVLSGNEFAGNSLGEYNYGVNAPHTIPRKG